MIGKLMSRRARQWSVGVALAFAVAVGAAQTAQAKENWVQLPGCAWSLAGNWVVGCGGGCVGGACIYQYNGGWNQVGFISVTPHYDPASGSVSLTYNYQGAVTITTDANGTPWIVDQWGNIFRLSPGSSPIFQQFGGGNCDNGAPVNVKHDKIGVSTIAVGSGGDPWIIDTALYPGTMDNIVRHWNGSCWQSFAWGAAQQVSVDYDGMVWVLNVNANAFFFVNNGFHPIPGTYKSITRGAALPTSSKRIAPWAPYGEMVITRMPSASMVQLYATQGGTPKSPAAGTLYAIDAQGQIFQYLGPQPAWFQDETESGDSSWTNDWDVCRGKVTCNSGEYLAGMSVQGYAGPARKAICLPGASAGSRSIFSGAVMATLSLDGGEQRRSTHGGIAWAPGYTKLECGAGEYVSGVSEDAHNCSPSPNDNKFHALQCAAGATGSNSCTERVFSNASNDLLEGIDWDPYNYKGACRYDEFVAGISFEPNNRAPYSLLCCSRPM